MLPQLPFPWGTVTDIRHKFYRIQILFCVPSCLNCTFECLLAAFFLPDGVGKQSPLHFFLWCSTFHRLFKYGPPPTPPPSKPNSFKLCGLQAWHLSLCSASVEIWFFQLPPDKLGKKSFIKDIAPLCSPQVALVQVMIIFNNQPVLGQIFLHTSSLLQNILSSTQNTVKGLRKETVYETKLKFMYHTKIDSPNCLSPTLIMETNGHIYTHSVSPWVTSFHHNELLIKVG